MSSAISPVSNAIPHLQPHFYSFSTSAQSTTVSQVFDAQDNTNDKVIPSGKIKRDLSRLSVVEVSRIIYQYCKVQGQEDDDKVIDELALDLIEHSSNFKCTTNGTGRSIIRQICSENISPKEILRISKEAWQKRQANKNYSYRDNTQGFVGIWKEGDIVVYTNCDLGSGQEKTVTLAYNLLNGDLYGAGFAPIREANLLKMFMGKRGIAQLRLTMEGIDDDKNLFMCQDLYYANLYQAMRQMKLNEADIKVIIIDMLYAMQNLERDSSETMIYHGDSKDKNVFLTVDPHTKRVLGAHLGDFGVANPVSKTEEHYHQTRKSQRQNMITTLFGKLLGYLRAYLDVENPKLSSYCLEESKSILLLAQALEKDHAELFEKLEDLHVTNPRLFWAFD